MARINRDVAGGFIFERGERAALRPVIHAKHDDGAHIRPELAGVGAARRICRHPIHVAVLAFAEPDGQPLRRLGNGVWRGNPAEIEAELARLGGESLFQKSRSA